MIISHSKQCCNSNISNKSTKENKSTALNLPTYFTDFSWMSCVGIFSLFAHNIRKWEKAKWIVLVVGHMSTYISKPLRNTQRRESVGFFIFIACNAMKENKDRDRIGSSYVPLDYVFVYVRSLSCFDIAFSGVGSMFAYVGYF